MSKSWALILGASSGLGQACARALAARRINIFGVYFRTAERQAEVEELVADLRGLDVEAHYFNENAASDPARRRVLAECTRRMALGESIGVMVHSLAFGALVPFLPRPSEDAASPAILTRPQMEMTMAVMAHSLVYWTQDLIQGGLLRAGARIFAMTSAGSTRVSLNYGAVSAAKCALESHVRQLALELAPRGIAVNAVRAGVTLTPALRRIPEHHEIIERALRGNPHGRLTLPEDVGEGIAALAALGSSWMTGNVIGLDGGEAISG